MGEDDGAGSFGEGVGEVVGFFGASGPGCAFPGFVFVYPSGHFGLIAMTLFGAAPSL